MGWLNLTALASRRHLDELEDWFRGKGALSVTVEDAGDDPIYEPCPAEMPLWDRVLVTGLFEAPAPVESLTGDLQAAGFEMTAMETLDDRPWEREWLKRFRPMRFGERIRVCPAGLGKKPVGGPADRIEISLDPGLAFGTGTHETTRLCLEYIDSAAPPPGVVIDYGCGSGILAIAAALLGAADVYGVDREPQAVAASRSNADRNGVTIKFGLVGEIELPRADLVLANLLARPLSALSGQLSALVAQEGALVLSGVTEGQSAWVKEAYRGKLLLEDESVLGGWVRLVFRRSRARKPPSRSAFS